MNGYNITSHIVLIVDQSGSMNKSDVPRHRTRSRAVYYNIANEIIAAPLLKGKTSYTDVVTLIEMRENAQIYSEIYKEPISWTLYNKFVTLANDEFRGSSHGHYYRSLEKAHEVLLESDKDNGTSALMLFFLSDGKPSDNYINADGYRGSHKDARRINYYNQTILQCVKEICIKFKERLTFGCFGFATHFSDFTIMQQMVETAKQYDIKNAFFQHGMDSNGLRGLLTTLITSLTYTRTMLSSMLPAVHLHNNKVLRPGMIQDTSSNTSNSTIFNPFEWDFYDTKSNRLERKTLQKGVDVLLRSDVSTRLYKRVKLLHDDATGIAIKKKFLGKGAERIVFEMTEVDEKKNPMGQPLVVKINPFQEDDGYDQLSFHTEFGATQKEASRLAKKFNERLDFRKVPDIVPRIKYLDCMYYTAWISGKECGWLVEKRLDPSRFMKWNDNQGGVHNLTQGKTNHMNEIALLVEDLHLDTIVEGEEDDDEDEEDENIEQKVNVKADVVTDRNIVLDTTYQTLLASILPDDVPQAFSHYTYRYSQRDRLVCDIQGELKHSSPPVFELTDPAIHSSQKGMFGKTDHGRDGMTAFFKTHKCNPLCEVLQLK